VLQVIAAAEALARGPLAGIYFGLLEPREVGPRVSHTIAHCLLELGRQRFEIEPLASTDPKLPKASHERNLGWVHRTELQHEVQQLEKVGRGPLRLGRKRPHKVDGGWLGRGGAS